MLVSLGSCLVMIVSAYGFEGVRPAEHVGLDPSRVAAQVVSGIGFLGAGMILRRSDTVYGLTTAASTWAVAAVGLATGGGLYVAACGSTAIILLVLTVMKRVETRLPLEPSRRRLAIEAGPGGFDSAEVPRLLEGTGMVLCGLVVSRGDKDGHRILIDLGQASDNALAAFIGRLQAHQGVREVAYEGHSHS
jgi:putative Mg2+ transporter-C (MgtC) family protein